MTIQAYYNDIDPNACAWMRELIKMGEIPDGIVDDRSILDVRPRDLPDTAHFFAGIGGWAYALQGAGWDPGRPVWTASLPCQPFSDAGRKRGTEDERHLWPVFRDLVGECRPPVIFGEQVASKLGRAWLASVFDDLEKLGYAVAAADICAAAVGAPHIRQRLYWCATLKSGKLCASNTDNLIGSLYGHKNLLEMQNGSTAGQFCMGVESEREAKVCVSVVREAEAQTVPGAFRPGRGERAGEEKSRSSEGEPCSRSSVPEEIPSSPPSKGVDETRQAASERKGDRILTGRENDREADSDRVRNDWNAVQPGRREKLGRSISGPDTAGTRVYGGKRQSHLVRSELRPGGMGSEHPEENGCGNTIDEELPRSSDSESSKEADKPISSVHDKTEDVGGYRNSGMAGIGAPHIRQRLYWCGLDIADGAGREPRWIASESARHGHPAESTSGTRGLPDTERNGFDRTRASGQGRRGESTDVRGGDWNDVIYVPCSDGKARPLKPGIEPLVDGVPDGLVRRGHKGVDRTTNARTMMLKGYGNAIVPQVAAQLVRTVMDFLDAGAPIGNKPLYVTRNTV